MAWEECALLMHVNMTLSGTCRIQACTASVISSITWLHDFTLIRLVSILLSSLSLSLSFQNECELYASEFEALVVAAAVSERSETVELNERYE